MKGKNVFTVMEADELRRLIQLRCNTGRAEQKGIRAKIRKLGLYGRDDFGINDMTIDKFEELVETGRITIVDEPEKSAKSNAIVSHSAAIKQSGKRAGSDESYVIDLCDEVLGQKAERQHHFSFLVGDSGKKLPVDAYYENLSLVVEYRERQHTESVAIFDKPEVLTVSGVPRSEQRRIYDQRRRDVLPMHGIKLVEINYSDLVHSANKKLLRDKEADLLVIQKLLKL